MQMDPLFASDFFISAFNTAILDGPLRIYFLHTNEEQGLETYYELREALGIKCRGVAPDNVCRNLYVVIYPEERDLAERFSKMASDAGFGIAKLGRDVVLGIHGKISQSQSHFWGEIAKLVQSEITNPVQLAAL